MKPSILFEVDNVKVTYVELTEKGVKFLSEPYEINTGLTAEFEDPLEGTSIFKKGMRLQGA